ncbi:MAG: DUF5686 family protein [Paludibacteraceae bacterium]
MTIYIIRIIRITLKEFKYFLPKYRVGQTPKTGIVFLLLFLFLFNNVKGQIPTQETIVVGQVVDKFDKTPLSSVDVYFKNSTISVHTNEEGYFLIRNSGKESTLVFSLLGYLKEEIKVKPGNNVGVQIELEEKEVYLTDVFVYPGANPADDLMKRVRAKRRQNNGGIQTNSTEQSAVFMSRDNIRWNSAFLKQFKSGNLSANDSLALIPMYMEQSEYFLSSKEKKQTAKNTYNTSQTVSSAVDRLLKGMDEKINFYENSVPLFGKSIISPLASISPSYYNYYLKDSTVCDKGKQYEIKFWSKNTKNLVFNGTMFIDSASMALVKINAELPKQVNLNFIRNFTVDQEFVPSSNRWLQKSERSYWELAYEIIADSLNKKTQLLIYRNVVFANDSVINLNQTTFAGSEYSEQEIRQRIELINETPLFKFAKFIADMALTGYVKVWKFDIGNIISVARLTEQEGLRISLPFRTNEAMWKNLMLGATLGYGFGDKEWKYGGEIQWKLPLHKRTIMGANYLNDYRWTSYDRNDFLARENPLISSDENISSTILSFKKG